MKRLLTLLLACTALVAAGCGSDEEEDPAPAGGGTAETTEDADSAATSGELTIAMKNFKFEPKNATVKVGQTVKWVNEDSAPHNAVDEEGGAFKSELFNKNETFEFTAKEAAGKIAYVCTIHPGMEGTLTVTE